MIVIEGEARRVPEVGQRSRILFLDRDGVINVDHGYVHTIDRFEWVDGIIEFGRAATALGMAIVVVSNQSGIARGLYGEAAFRDLSVWMMARLAEQGVPIRRVIGCQHHPAGTVEALAIDCNCRKPAPGMIKQALADLRCEPAQSALIGDRVTDVQAGNRAGLGLAILLGARTGVECPADHQIASDLHDARQQLTDFVARPGLLPGSLAT